jgi:hypothetical protein
MFIPDPNFFHPGSEFFSSRILDPNFSIQDSGSRIRIKEFENFNPKTCFDALGNMIRVVLPGSGLRIRIMICYPSRIQGSKDTGSWILGPDLFLKLFYS